MPLDGKCSLGNLEWKALLRYQLCLKMSVKKGLVALDFSPELRWKEQLAFWKNGEPTKKYRWHIRLLKKRVSFPSGTEIKSLSEIGIRSDHESVGWEI